jgi:hypothetical protein
MGLFDFFKKMSSPRNSAAFAAVNLLLGLGPLIIPSPFFHTGFYFSIFWTIIICLLNYLSASYIG